MAGAVVENDKMEDQKDGVAQEGCALAATEEDKRKSD